MSTIERWEKHAKDAFVGRKIVNARYMTPEEVEAMGWTQSVVVLQLNDGSVIYPSMDDEGNNGGALFGNTRDGHDLTMPVIRDYS
jgi:hypothetical protein